MQVSVILAVTVLPPYLMVIGYDRVSLDAEILRWGPSHLAAKRVLVGVGAVVQPRIVDAVRGVDGEGERSDGAVVAGVQSGDAAERPGRGIEAGAKDLVVRAVGCVVLERTGAEEASEDNDACD